MFVKGFVDRWIFHRFLNKLYDRYKGKQKLLIIADNLSAHKVAEIKILCTKYNHKLLLNIPFWSCANPIEFFFGLLKKRLKLMPFLSQD